MAILIDTNLLLRSVQPQHPMYAHALGAISSLLKRREQLAVSIQNVAEFWNVATRPESQNGLGFSVEEARYEVLSLEQFFKVIHETEVSYAIWKALVSDNRVSGVRVHDARLVAVMLASGIRQIMTFNGADFIRYAGIEVLDPMNGW